MMEYVTYTPDMLPAFARFWNESFRDKRNFFPVNEEILRRRIFEKETAVERFEPSQSLVALEGGNIAGALHYMIRDERICRALSPGWPGGEQGCIAFFHVASAFRGRGVGTRLFDAATAAMKNIRQIIIDTQCHNPFYGNSTGPRAPLWGHTEGIGIDIGDTQTIAFLNRRSFTMTNSAQSLLLDFKTAPPPETACLPVGTAPEMPQDCKLHMMKNAQPPVGGRPGESVPYDSDCEYTSIACVSEGVVAGVITFYEMKEVNAGKGAIYMLEVAEGHRRRGLGRALVAAAVEEMRRRGWKSCETLTVPLLSPGAVAIYRALGFRRAARWAIY